jgi:hypothetical protein
MSQQGNEPGGEGGEEERAGREPSLCAYLARILGYESTQAIERALRTIELSLTHRTALVLIGETDMVPIALALHRRTLGSDRPFILANPRRADRPATSRSPMSYTSGVAAVQAAYGGSLCMRHRRLPHDFASTVRLLRDPATSVQIINCSDVLRAAMHPFVIRPATLRVPTLEARAHELPRIVDEYADDAVSTLGARAAHFTKADRRWVLDHATSSLAEIETATLRLVALRQAEGVVFRAAARLDLSNVGLTQWLQRRRRWRPRRRGQ